MKYQLKLKTPFATLGVSCDEHYIADIDYLPLSASDLPPQNLLAAEAAGQFRAYLRDGKFQFNLPFLLRGTPHCKKVWGEILKIPAGESRAYGQIAAMIKSSARAVGGACRANRLPLLIPCHRVVAAAGIGGFMGSDGRHQLKVKRWLLAHESAQE